MASSTNDAPPPSLATLLSIKQKMAAKNATGSDSRQAPPPIRPPVANAYSNERIAYHQNLGEINSQPTIPTTAPENPVDPPKISRKTKQLEVGLLDKKLDEINRKQEEKTNQALDTWKGFDSVNYGFGGAPVQPVAEKQQRTSTPPLKQQEQPSTTVQQPLPTKQASPIKQTSNVEQPAASKEPTPRKQQSPAKESSPARHQPPAKQPSPTRHHSPAEKSSPVKQQAPAEKSSPVEQPRPAKQPPPKRIDSPVKDQAKTESPPQKRKASPPQERPRKDPSPVPPPSHEKKPIEQPVSRSPSPPVQQQSRAKSPEQERSRSIPRKSPSPVIENTVPISSAVSNPQIFQKPSQTYDKSPLPISNGSYFKLFPDIKNYEMRKPRNAMKSIQRSMDRYRFHVW